MKNYPRHILSKSTYMYGIQCQKRLFFNKYRRDLLPEITEQQQAIFQGGTDAGILAQELFPDGIDATPNTPFEYQKAIVKTQTYLMTNDVIYEASFQFESVMCAIDILVNKNGKWHAYEVKGTNSVKEQHLADASFQYYIMKQTGLEIEDFSIIHFNKNYVRAGDINVQHLFTTESVLDKVLEMQLEVSANIQSCKATLILKEEPIIDAGNQCFIPYECPFIHHCWKNRKEAEPEKLSSLPIVQSEMVHNFINTLSYPLHFFNLETYMNGIPLFNQSSPFQQIPFQYSLHQKQSNNSELTHYEFLGNGIDDPREQLIQQMIHDLGSLGNIITCNMSLEKMRINELQRDFPNYEHELRLIDERIVDLMLPFKMKWIDIPTCEGSASIKKVLPIFITDLSYDTLDIQDGLYASFVYNNLRFQSDEIQELQRTQLFSYCAFDTFAMVKIFERILAIL
jgi:hypothetical protein